MSLDALKKSIEQKKAKVAVIGLGYVGLPVACTFAEAGFDVTGVDLVADRVAKINAGVSPIEGNEPGLPELIAKVAGRKLKATTNYEDLRDVDVILIAVETPVAEDNKPRYEALRGSLKSLGAVLKDGALVVIESTIAPGTMAKVVQPVLEETSGKKAGGDFYLGNCPERVMPGKLLKNLRNLSRVVGGSTHQTAETMVALYRQIILTADLDATDCITAELVKTAENAYRDVQIAFANEVAMIAEATGGDVWKVRELVNKSPDRMMLLPGAGVGGHCIPKDPWLLAYGVDGSEVELKLIPTARAVNDGMPSHILDMLRKALGELKGKRVLVLGYAYLEDSDDTRNSPSAALVDALQAAGATPVVHDPFVHEYQGDLLALAKGCDAAVLMVKHSEYRQMDLSKLAALLSSRVLVDGRGLWPSAAAKHAGLTYFGIGQGAVAK
jgi:UDP-N-acetyl-D-mannosaminuronic acid dehydrogenase